MKKKRVNRFDVTYDPQDGWSLWDMLFAEAVDSRTFRTKKAASKAVNKLNREDRRYGRNYVRLVNGYVAVAHSWDSKKGPVMSEVAR